MTTGRGRGGARTGGRGRGARYRRSEAEGGRRRVSPELLTGVRPVEEALRAGRRRLHRLLLRRGRHPAAGAALEQAARARGLAVEWLPREEFEAALAGRADPEQSRGVALEAGPLPECGLSTLLERIVPAAPPVWVVALDGVEDPQNLGAIARVADAAGADALLLPRRRASPPTAAASRASAGALEHLPVVRVANLGDALRRLRRAGAWTLGADARGGAELFALADRVFEGPLVFVFGREGAGLRRSTLGLLDERVKIPTVGKVASLNVATAAAVVLFEARRRRGAGGAGRSGTGEKAAPAVPGTSHGGSGRG